MSSPTDETEKHEDHLKYAPKWARNRNHSGSPSIAGGEFPQPDEQSLPAEEVRVPLQPDARTLGDPQFVRIARRPLAEGERRENRETPISERDLLQLRHSLNPEAVQEPWPTPLTSPTADCPKLPCHCSGIGRSGNSAVHHGRIAGRRAQVAWASRGCDSSPVAILGRCSKNLAKSKSCSSSSEFDGCCATGQRDASACCVCWRGKRECPDSKNLAKSKSCSSSSEFDGCCATGQRDASACCVCWRGKREWPDHPRCDQ